MIEFRLAMRLCSTQSITQRIPSTPLPIDRIMNHHFDIEIFLSLRIKNGGSETIMDCMRVTEVVSMGKRIFYCSFTAVLSSETMRFWEPLRSVFVAETGAFTERWKMGHQTASTRADKYGLWTGRFNLVFGREVSVFKRFSVKKLAVHGSVLNDLGYQTIRQQHWKRNASSVDYILGKAMPMYLRMHTEEQSARSMSKKII
jgi:hypothetical protein